MATFRKVSKGNAGKLIHVYVDSAKADNGRILEFFGIKKEDGHVSRIIQVCVLILILVLYYCCKSFVVFSYNFNFVHCFNSLIDYCND